VAKFLLRTLEFAFYQLLICIVDRVSRLPRDSWPPDAMRLYRENLALKVQLDALAAEVTRVRGKKARVSLRTRAAQVWAYLVTRGNPPFQKHNLSASPRTIQRWATKLRQGLLRRSEPKTPGGRPPMAVEIVELVLALRREKHALVTRCESESSNTATAGASESMDSYRSAPIGLPVALCAGRQRAFRREIRRHRPGPDSPKGRGGKGGSGPRTPAHRS
jgi:hypothetical protein